MESKIDEFAGKFRSDEEISEHLPIPHSDEVDIKMKLVYSDVFVKQLNRLRFLLQHKEYSQRGFELSEHIIREMKNHYAAWVYRRDLLHATNNREVYQDELEFCNVMIIEEPKGFQTWEHKRFCSLALNEIDQEREAKFLDIILALDSKNYHAWSFRVWMTKQFNLFAEEWALIDAKLKNQIDNNSVWSYRKFLSKHLSVSIETEEDLCYSLLLSHLDVESIWYYLDDLYESSKLFSPKLKDFCLQRVKEGSINRFVLGFMIINELRAANDGYDRELVQENLKLLKETHDRMRMAYWSHFEDHFLPKTSHVQ